jgi:hypothetical protein
MASSSSGSWATEWRGETGVAASVTLELRAGELVALRSFCIKDYLKPAGWRFNSSDKSWRKSDATFADIQLVKESCTAVGRNLDDRAVDTEYTTPLKAYPNATYLVATSKTPTGPFIVVNEELDEYGFQNLSQEALTDIDTAEKAATESGLGKSTAEELDEFGFPLDLQEEALSQINAVEKAAMENLSQNNKNGVSQGVTEAEVFNPPSPAPSATIQSPTKSRFGEQPLYLCGRDRKHGHCTVLVSQTAGNPNRAFYRCQRCDHFQWCDVAAVITRSRSRPFDRLNTPPARHISTVATPGAGEVGGSKKRSASGVITEAMKQVKRAAGFDQSTGRRTII